MKLLVDTSVWSLAFLRNTPAESPEVDILSRSLDGDSEVYSTGLILQELLQGFSGLKAAEAIVERFTALPMVVPDTRDYIEAAQVRNLCRRKGVQVGTIDALIAQLAPLILSCSQQTMTSKTCQSM
ncbi:MAG: PIN domain-containing protein [Candidatus Competibacteraceae bacterium]|nr:PIN domain-containing protein [Candidatus Competibacteraceae bacterium]